MPLSIAGLSMIRAALVADVQTAWSPTRIYTSPAETETPADGDGLPVAFIVMEPAPFDSRLNSLCVAVPVYSVRIRGRFEKPEGVDLVGLKDAKANALLNQLTATAGRYAGAAWFADEVSYDPFPDATDAVRGYYTLEIGMSFHLTS